MARMEAGPCDRWLNSRCSRESWKTTLESQGTWSENWHSDSLEKVQLTLYQGKKKKGDDIADDEDDDVVRTSVSQDRVTATLCTDELFPQHKVYMALFTYQKGLP
jgi:hypothetical protein